VSYPRLRRYHLIVDDISSDLAVLLGTARFELVEDLVAEIRALQQRNVLRPWRVMLPQTVRMFRCRNELSWVLAKPNQYRWLEDSYGHFELDLAIIDHHNDEFAEDILRRCFGDKLRNGSAYDANPFSRELDALLRPSVNGKLLQNDNIRSACTLLYDEAKKTPGNLSTAERTALIQGLWLEHLVTESLRPFTTQVWTGAIVAQYEIDVLARIAGQLVVVECKDTSLGQRDYIMTQRKAQIAHADAVLLISTQPLHSNVLATINADVARAAENEESFIPIFWHDAFSSHAIDAAISDFADLIAQHSLKNWLREEERSMSWEDFFEEGCDWLDSHAPFH
jgi:hypothetical protein